MFIHPCGGWPNSTLGCIGLQENAEKLLDFYDKIIEYWETYGKYPIVRVKYLNSLIP